MTNDEFLSLKEDYIDNIEKYVKEEGSLFPHVSIFADFKNPKESEGKPAIIHIPIPDEYMENDNSKEEFVETVLPDIFSKVKEKFIPVAVGWASEAWMRIADKKENVTDYKKLPIKKEVIIITIEANKEMNFSQCALYEIKRNGIQVNSDGELKNNVTLEFLEGMDPKEMGGRFSQLLSKFKD